MKRYTLSVVAAMLLLPATALASSSQGVVLSVDGAHHEIQVVDPAHVVHLYRYHGRLPRLHAGSRIRFSRSGRLIRNIRGTSGRAGTVAFYARVVRSSAHGVTLVAADGHRISLSASQLAARRGRHTRAQMVTHAALGITAGSVTINLLGLQPGVTVLVTESTDSSGNTTVTITLPPTPPTPQSQQASGTVSEVDTDAFVVVTADGSELRMHMAEQDLANLNLSSCQTVDVTYHQDAGMLIADDVQTTGTSTTGDCTPTFDATGTITVLSDQAVTISTDQGPMKFGADPSLTDGYYVGDLVDVTYTQNADGSLTATDVEYVEMDASGTVTAASATSLTLTDSESGQTDRFVADPYLGVQIDGQTFAGIQAGDYVDVSYHQSAAGLVADCVDDSGPASGGISGNGGFGGSNN